MPNDKFTVTPLRGSQNVQLEISGRRAVLTPAEAERLGDELQQAADAVKPHTTKMPEIPTPDYGVENWPITNF